MIIKSGIEHIGISDHSLIYMHRKISIPRTPPKIVKTRQYKYYNNQLFKSDLREIFTNDVYQSEDPNELWNDWKTRFLIIADKHAPPITRKVRSEYSPWLTSNITKQMRHRDYLKKQAI